MLSNKVIKKIVGPYLSFEEFFHCGRVLFLGSVCGTLKLKFERNGAEYQKALKVNLCILIQLPLYTVQFFYL